MNESTLVPREEMSDLDWLARNVHKWSGCDSDVLVKFLGENALWIAPDSCRGESLTRKQWLARRAELQNKPSWKDAPEWAEWLAQDEDGEWWFFSGKPKAQLVSFDERGSGISADYAKKGETLGDWRDTLEKRPETCLKSMSGVHSDGDMLALHDELKDFDMNKFEPFVSVYDVGTVSETAGQQYRGDIQEIAVNKHNDAMKDAATAKQPAPKGSGNPILGMVLADLTNRALEGKEKYGEPLLAHNGRNPLWDAYQEALDLAMYLRQAIEEQKQC